MQRKRTVIDKMDDFDGTPGAETVSFGFEGAHYEMELTEANRKELADLLDPYITRARRVVRSKRTRPSKPAAKVVREWAAEQGIDCPKTGRVPAEVVEQYQQAS